MLEIIALYFLCKLNGKLAVRKGLKPTTWRVYTIVAWIVAEIIGLILGLALFGQDNMIGLMAFSMVSAFGGYLYIKYLLEKMPDPLEDDINSIGIDDLRPPSK